MKSLLVSCSAVHPFPPSGIRSKAAFFIPLTSGARWGKPAIRLSRRLSTVECACHGIQLPTPGLNKHFPIGSESKDPQICWKEVEHALPVAAGTRELELYTKISAWKWDRDAHVLDLLQWKGLRSLSLTGFRLALDRLPGSLEELDLQFFLPCNFKLDGLEHLTNLKSLTIDCLGYWKGPDFTEGVDLSPLLKLTALETLKMWLPRKHYQTPEINDAYAAFLHKLHLLPNLRDLHIECEPESLPLLRPRPNVSLHLDLKGSLDYDYHMLQRSRHPGKRFDDTLVVDHLEQLPKLRVLGVRASRNRLPYPTRSVLPEGMQFHQFFIDTDKLILESDEEALAKSLFSTADLMSFTMIGGRLRSRSSQVKALPEVLHKLASAYAEARGCKWKEFVKALHEERDLCRFEWAPKEFQYKQEPLSFMSEFADLEYLDSSGLFGPQMRCY